MVYYSHTNTDPEKAMKTQIERAAAIAKMMNDFGKSREAVEANVFSDTDFVVCANDNAVTVLTLNAEGAIKFAFTNTPRTYPATLAHSLTQRWNRVHGAKHPVRVIPASEWKHERLIEIKKSVDDLFEMAANNH